jgi:hypothetical protein
VKSKNVKFSILVDGEEQEVNISPCVQTVFFKNNNGDIIDSIDPQIHSDIINSFNKEVEKQIYSSLGVPPELFNNNSYTWNGTISFETTHSLTYEDVERFERLFHPVNPLHQTIINTCIEYGLHPDMIERVEYVLNTNQGTELALQLTFDDVREPDIMIQMFLKIYDDMTK